MRQATRAGARTAILTVSETPFAAADWKLGEPLADVLPARCDRVLGEEGR